MTEEFCEAIANAWFKAYGEYYNAEGQWGGIYITFHFLFGNRPER